MVLNLLNLQSMLSTIDGQSGTGIPHQIFLDVALWRKTIHHKLVTTRGIDAYSRSQIKIWLQKFRNGALPCQDAPCTGLRVAICGISSKLSFCQCPSTCAALHGERADK
jgi:hypothetical protein